LYRWFLEPPDTVAEAIWQAVRRRAPRVVPGMRHRLLLGVVRLVPRGLVARGGQAVKKGG
jgi:short-subunit dehydrogenase